MSFPTNEHYYCILYAFPINIRAVDVGEPIRFAHFAAVAAADSLLFGCCSARFAQTRAH